MAEDLTLRLPGSNTEEIASYEGVLDIKLAYMNLLSPEQNPEANADYLIHLDNSGHEPIVTLISEGLSLNISLPLVDMISLILSTNSDSPKVVSEQQTSTEMDPLIPDSTGREIPSWAIPRETEPLDDFTSRLKQSGHTLLEWLREYGNDVKSLHQDARVFSEL
jgi:hypothetical protein